MKAKNELRLWNSLRDGNKHFCQYCGIEQQDFLNVWARNKETLKLGFRHGENKPGTRGHHLEIDHKDGDKNNDDEGNLAHACYACNNAKSDVFTDVEFERMGEVIRQIYHKRAKKKGFHLTEDPNSK
ncbi:MAG: hypothetical protein HY528_01445 [Chloroflexi bacterium]|nr:hypothetical protein [Chloroflexota bacterium]